MKKFSTRKLFKVVIIVAIFGLIVFLNPKGISNPLKAALGKISYPFEKIAYSVSYEIKNWGDFIFSIGQIKKENSEFLHENQKLLSENARLHDIERENAFLREQVGLLPREKFELDPAFIISQDPQGLGNFIEINKGSKDGISEGMAVTVSKGVFIGRVENVFSDRSTVMLLSNPRSAVNVIVAQSGAKALVKGEYGLGIIADSILQTDSVSVGNEVVTSGMGSDIPKGLLVGIVEELRPSSDHLFRQAVISSPEDVSGLEIVFVVKGIK